MLPGALQARQDHCQGDRLHQVPPPLVLVLLPLPPVLVQRPLARAWLFGGLLILLRQGGRAPTTTCPRTEAFAWGFAAGPTLAALPRSIIFGGIFFNFYQEQQIM